MTMGSVSGVSSSSEAATEQALRNQSIDQLGKMDFLQILVTQLRYQDPMNPVDDREFASQLAQFSALEQMTEQTRWARMTYGLSLVGQEVTYITKETGLAATGVISAFKTVAGKPVLSLGTIDIEIDQVVKAMRPQSAKEED